MRACLIIYTPAPRMRRAAMPEPTLMAMIFQVANLEELSPDTFVT
jgi:hypothetical protein